MYLSKEAFAGWLERTQTTHSALAEELGVSAGLISSWKAGRRFPSEVNQRKLVELVQGSGGAGASEAFDPQRFQAWRAERGLSRKALATELGVSPGSIYQWESGKSQPRPSTLEKMREVIQAKGLTSPTTRRPARGSSESSEAERAAAIEAAGQTLAALISARELGLEEVRTLAPRLRDAFLSSR